MLRYPELALRSRESLMLTQNELTKPPDSSMSLNRGDNDGDISHKVQPQAGSPQSLLKP